jgi:RimJ/RimL family protein N-acetyltransferase
MTGRFCELQPLDSTRHASDLHEAYALDRTGEIWTYLAAGPWSGYEPFRAWLEEQSRSDDPLFYSIVLASSRRAVGLASYLRIAPAHGSIEVGHIVYSPLLQRTPAATEAMFLLMKRAFELGYRRYEWKCDALNAKSRAAAQRLGFSFEGVFRQATVYKGRNRDTAWFSVIDREWPALSDAFTQWLAPSNFDEQGRQGVRLSDRGSLR